MNCTLQFSPGNSKRASSRIIPNTNRKERNSTRCSCCAGFVDVLSWLYQKIAGRQGLLGVNGKHFRIVFICRELLQTSLQTVQAIRMSKYLPRLLLNRFYVSLVAINCWSSFLVDSRWFWNNEARRRFAVILFDVVLNLVSTLGMPLIIVLSYLDMYRAKALEFDFSILGDEIWAAQLLNEAQMVVVVSWPDLMSRIVFSLGLVASTSDMKDLLRSGPSNGNRVMNQSCAVNNLSCVVPPGSDTAKEVNIYDDSCSTNAYSKQAELQVPRRRRTLKLVHIANAAWGVVLIALHVQASIQEPPYQCLTKVRPMVGVRPSCYIVNFDCHALGISGRLDEVQSEWSKFDKMTSTNLQALPDDLDAKWPSGAGIYIENNKLTEIPPALARLKPVYLMARGNPIAQIPSELFEAVLSYLTLGGSNLAELPQNVAEPSTALAHLDVSDTDISFFWSWMEPLVEDMFGVMPLVAAGGTPYCDDLDNIMSGASSEFSTPFQANESPLLMNASVENWDYLLQAVDCSPSFGLTLFPLES
ncbi:hypothetical protein JG688_00006295 [Phytophthora aleatoria]|uniref:Uncharacterized protein n=1 Tax=Phytophthora aleatoria TaxID=2496075 RepID=A0A8J5ING3_9STRA|nr:hypothetical protein JG688_00006295 [Phytophthora aleatoria]